MTDDAESPISNDDLNTQAVLIYGNGQPSTSVFADAFTTFVIPELIAYENGLTLFLCRGENWPEICHSKVSPERINKLLADLSSVGFFNESRIPSPSVGPHGNKVIIARTAEMSGAMKWPTTGGAVVPSEPTYPLPSVLKIIETFTTEAQADKRLYWPKEVAFWIWKPCDCNAPPVSEKGARGLCNLCDELNSIRKWSFNFEPPYEMFTTKGCHSYLELPQSISVIMSVVPDLKKQPLDYSHYADSYKKTVFRDGDMIWSIEIRPYLPGEKGQVSCSEDRWDGRWPAYDDTLPFHKLEPTPTP